MGVPFNPRAKIMGGTDISLSVSGIYSLLNFHFLPGLKKIFIAHRKEKLCFLRLTST